ncbi:type II toxin-antitoxin system RelE/ParE family toxin [Ferruginibacter sp. SUN106]|uniref:type II toxin-antitoxin system RelE/ParE family toxin n=1 Tax=Ferruginibacter sp. SUN106 TaxID=2978348 RepID=UPI003D3631FE
MASPKPVIISPGALKDLDQTYEWILYKFGKPTLQNFHIKWGAFLDLISLQPAIFPYLDKRKGLRKYTFYKRNLVIYKNKRNHIEIVAVFNTWQNPKKAK